MKVTTKLAKNDARLYYVNSKRVSRDKALESAAQNRVGNPFVVECDTEQNHYLIQGGIEKHIYTDRRTFDKLNIRIDNYHGFTVYCGTCQLRTFACNFGAKNFAMQIEDAFINGEHGIKITVDGKIGILPAENVGNLTDSALAASNSRLAAFRTNDTEIDVEDYAVTVDAQDVAIKAEIEPATANSEEIAETEEGTEMTNQTQNAVSTPAIKKFEVGKTYAAKKTVLFDSQINMTVIKRTKCYVSFQFDDEDDIRRCKIVDDAGVEKICLHETNAIGGDYEFSATEMKNQSANAVSTPAIETRIASNGAVSVYVNGKRTSREEAIEIAEQNDLPTYTATCYPYSERNYCINEDFATALSAYKWMEREADKNLNVADGCFEIKRYTPRFENGKKIYEETKIYELTDFGEEIDADDEHEPEFAKFIYAKNGESLISQRYERMMLFHDQLIGEGLTEEQINQVLVAQYNNANGREHCNLIKEFKAQNAAKAEANVEDYAVSTEAQDAAIEAEIENAKFAQYLLDEAQREHEFELLAAFGEEAPEFKRYGSFKPKAAHIDTTLQAKTFKPAPDTPVDAAIETLDTDNFDTQVADALKARNVAKTILDEKDAIVAKAEAEMRQACDVYEATKANILKLYKRKAAELTAKIKVPERFMKVIKQNGTDDFISEDLFVYAHEIYNWDKHVGEYFFAIGKYDEYEPELTKEKNHV